MNYVTLGKTGLKAAVVSFGGIPIQRADGANTKAVVDKLEEYGINYIDTARGYTSPRSIWAPPWRAAGTSLSWQPRA